MGLFDRFRKKAPEPAPKSEWPKPPKEDAMALLLMGNQEAALFTYVVPFLISTIGGCILAAMLLGALYKSGAFHYLKSMIGDEPAIRKERQP